MQNSNNNQDIGILVSLPEEPSVMAHYILILSSKNISQNFAMMRTVNCMVVSFNTPSQLTWELPRYIPRHTGSNDSVQGGRWAVRHNAGSHDMPGPLAKFLKYFYQGSRLDITEQGTDWPIGSTKVLHGDSVPPNRKSLYSPSQVPS